MLNTLAQEIFQNAISKGFYENGAATNMGERIALVHSELSEALEADRNGCYCTADLSQAESAWGDNNVYQQWYKDNVKGTFEEEVADVIIRMLDMAAFKGINVEAHVTAKMYYNSLREYKHGKKY